ncbi:N-acetylmuramoyl-L-alanine amidase [Halarcobacter anaerophilus]|uniref:N-acetylmuramoyl-L-alanine amidase n=1 Tax=Halarcobacter anaerophilus TaxID=877500 RepID=A0A4Q0XZL6_9BACT|nr:N-acetylmuramoyl-L-alanine amidase [Halarcobacter anaerophilus]QDF30183.1 N-acetylmuramoyl-L-alanine amidase [Halarcobacter anaerophilus]RXJ62254.1 N-acetylmuramoyl-L-alanine amidase [Halarcobacter anaerophilus]
MKNNYPGVIVHCSDSSFGNAQIIENWHKQRGWKDIGYHLVILNGQVENNTYLDFMDGEVEMGRDWDMAGAHAKGYNDYLGICMIGVNSFTNKQFEMLAKVLKSLMEKYNWSLENILFHYEISSKTCPNFDKKWFLEKFMQV